MKNNEVIAEKPFPNTGVTNASSYGNHMCQKRREIAFVVFDIFDFVNTATLKSGSGVTRGHRNWYHSIDRL